MADMHDPAHPGEIIREAITTEGWTIRHAADRLGVARITLQRVLSGHAGVSPRMAIALEGIGWSNAAFWVRLQGRTTWRRHVERSRRPLEPGHVGDRRVRTMRLS